MKDWEEEFDKKFLTDYLHHKKVIYNKPDEIKQFISSLLSQQSETPMGVSQWKEYGRRYKYWEYFEDDIRKEVISYCTNKIMSDLINLPDWNSGDNFEYTNGEIKSILRGYLKDILINLNKPNL